MMGLGGMVCIVSFTQTHWIIPVLLIMIASIPLSISIMSYCSRSIENAILNSRATMQPQSIVLHIVQERRNVFLEKIEIVRDIMRDVDKLKANKKHA